MLENERVDHCSPGLTLLPPAFHEFDSLSKVVPEPLREHEPSTTGTVKCPVWSAT
jgi:hypothetical protein